MFKIANKSRQRDSKPQHISEATITPVLKVLEIWVSGLDDDMYEIYSLSYLRYLGFQYLYLYFAFCIVVYVTLYFAVVLGYLIFTDRKYICLFYYIPPLRRPGTGDIETPRLSVCPSVTFSFHNVTPKGIAVFLYMVYSKQKCVRGCMLGCQNNIFCAPICTLAFKMYFGSVDQCFVWHSTPCHHTSFSHYGHNYIIPTLIFMSFSCNMWQLSSNRIESQDIWFLPYE